MTEQQPPARPRSRVAGYGALVLAVLIAVGAGTYLLLSGTSSSGTSSGGLAAAGTAGASTGVLDPARPKEGDKAPDFVLADARNPGQSRKLSDFKGKAVVLNWYASWCSPCREEIPEFQQAQEKLASQVVFVGIDYEESPSQAVSILDDLKATYPALLDASGAIADHYRVGQGGGGLPTTFFIDKDGILRGQVLGRVTPDKLTEYLSKVGISYQAPAETPTPTP